MTWFAPPDGGYHGTRARRPGELPPGVERPMELRFETPTGQTAAVWVERHLDAVGCENEYTVELTLTILRQLLEQAGYTEMSQRLSEPAV